MDLDKLRDAKKTFEAFSPETRAVILADAKQVEAHMAEAFPAINETDQAAVALFIAQMLAVLRIIPVSEIDRMLLDSASAYSLAAVDLLGWLDA